MKRESMNITEQNLGQKHDIISGEPPPPCKNDPNDPPSKKFSKDMPLKTTTTALNLAILREN